MHRHNTAGNTNPNGPLLPQLPVQGFPRSLDCCLPNIPPLQPFNRTREGGWGEGGRGGEIERITINRKMRQGPDQKDSSLRTNVPPLQLCRTAHRSPCSVLIMSLSTQICFLWFLLKQWAGTSLCCWDGERETAEQIQFQLWNYVMSVSRLGAAFLIYTFDVSRRPQGKRMQKWIGSVDKRRKIHWWIIKAGLIINIGKQ